MNPVTAFLLDACFWDHLDAGVPPEQTPLLTGIFENQSLADVVSLRFGLSPTQAAFEIEAARREVEL